MTKDKKIITIGIFTLISFLITFITFFNDLITYSIVFCTTTVILFIYLSVVIFRKQKSSEEKYDIELNSILKRYDSIIVYSDTNYSIEEKTILYVKNIEDLIRYCDEVNKTIVYIKEDESCTFILKNDEELLVYIMKKKDNSRSIMEEKIEMNIEKKEDNIIDEISDDIEKTTIIKLKNNKLYKISPISKENE